jgi:Tol biopolymer transport system component
MRKRDLAEALMTLIVLACGGGLPNLGGQDAGDAAPPEEAATDSTPDQMMGPPCDTTKPFGVPAQVAMVVRGFDYAPFLSMDELTMFFTRSVAVADGGNASNIFSTKRTSTQTPFGTAVLSGVTGPSADSDAALSADGLTMYFASDRANPGGNFQIYVATRASTSADFGTPTMVLDVDDPNSDNTQPVLDVDGSLWFASTRAGNGDKDIYHALPTGTGFNAPVPESELNSPQDDWSTTLTSDGLTMYFASKRANYDNVFVATRTSVSAVFSTPELVNELVASASDLPHWLSMDRCRLYLGQSDVTQTSYSIYVATRPQ